MLIAAFVALMSRVVFALDAISGVLGSPGCARPRSPRPNRPAVPDRAPDPDWWPRFESEFAEYVDRLA
jgi:hypothetical protein